MSRGLSGPVGRAEEPARKVSGGISGPRLSEMNSPADRRRREH